MKKHRIFTIGWEYPPNITGGLGIACQGLARALARRGNGILFMVPRLSGQEKQEQGIELFDVKSRLNLLSPEELEELSLHSLTQKAPPFSAYSSSGVVSSLIAPEAVDGLEELDGPILRGGYGHTIYEEVHKYAAFAAYICKRMQFDIIHTHDWMTFPAGLRVQAITGKPHVCHVHATEFDRSGENVNQYVYDLEREAFHRATAVVTVSNYTRNILIDRYGVSPDKIFAVHNAVEFEVPEHILGKDRPRRGIDEKLVLFLGRMTFQKGPDYFVRAAKHVIEKMQNVRFIMVGSGDMFHRMIEMAADMGIGKFFHYTGFLNREQVQHIYSISDLYVMPSVSEPFGISPLEAMSHGVPVIVSKQSGVSEIIHNAIKVDFWDVNELANQITRLLSDEDLLNSLRKNGTYEVKNITWEDSARKMEAIFNGLTGG